MSAQEEAQKWMSVRLAVSAALIIGSSVFYVAYWIAMFRKEDKKSYIYINEVAAKYFLFGLGALMSLNYSQAGIYQTIMSFFTMAAFLGLVATALMPESVDDRKRSIMYIIYYSFLFAWYLGIMIDFFVTYK